MRVGAQGRNIVMETAGAQAAGLWVEGRGLRPQRTRGVGPTQRTDVSPHEGLRVYTVIHGHTLGPPVKEGPRSVNVHDTYFVGRTQPKNHPPIK